MSYVFSLEEQQKLSGAALACEGMLFDRVEEFFAPVAMAGRNCTPLYRMLSEVINEKLVGSEVFGNAVVEILKNAKLWLDVAIDANGGKGVYSALIRAYTLRQGQLRLSTAFDEDLMQESSNQVAVNLMNTLVRGSPVDDLAAWNVPSISQIASIDASAIGDVLFSTPLGEQDTAASRNSGWSGTVGFCLLGGSLPYETWRLTSAGDPGSEVKGKHGLAKVNRLDDFKNILFAVDAYRTALLAVVENFGSNVLESLSSVIPEQINIAFSSKNINPLIQSVVKGTPISSTVDLILKYGVNTFFDMLKYTYDGVHPSLPTTDETFAANAYAFFSSLTADQCQNIVAKHIGEYGRASDWGLSASQDTASAKALRNALKCLSEIVIERADGFAGRGLELYDAATGEGVLTEQWLVDRAQMLGRLIARSGRSFGDNSSQAFAYSDLLTGKQVTLPIGVMNAQVMFGDDEGRNVSGGTKADHLYGGSGHDVIHGHIGEDYIEGGGGNDSLAGGDGRDALHGMSGNDVLAGGKGNDLLVGGAGADQYEFSSGDGIDQIHDLDPDGHLLIDGHRITKLARSAPLSNSWLTEDGRVTVSLVEERSGDTLHIHYGLDDVIVIRHYLPGMFGIQLPGYKKQSFAKPYLTVTGDRKAEDADPETAGEQLAYDDFGNVVVKPKVKQSNKADVLYGSIHHDVLIGLGGADQLFGKAGNDRLFGDKQLSIEKALAADTASGQATRGDWLDGGLGDDVLIGSSSTDVLLGAAGADTLVGGAGNDNLSGDGATGEVAQSWDFKRVEVPFGKNSGDTSWHAVLTNASFSSAGEGGNDVLYGQGGHDFMTAGPGDDLLDGGAGSDVMAGDQGNDTLRGGADGDILLGDNHDSAGGLQSQHHGNDLLEGGDGDDELAGNGGSDVLYGGPGNDDLKGDDQELHGIDGHAARYFGTDVLDGGEGNDTLQGGGAGDSLYGGAGHDDLSGDFADHPDAHQGDDYLEGGEGDDTLRGMGGCDTLSGGPGADALDGDEHNLQAGGIHDDHVRGGMGNDTLWGGGGSRYPLWRG